MPITLQQAKNLNHHDILHHEENKNSDGTCQRWKVNGVPKTWKTRPNEVRVPVKHGFRSFDYVTEKDLHLVHLEEDCPYRD